MARIGQDDVHAGIQEGEFPQPMLDRAVVELDHREGFGRRKEGHFRSALRATLLHRRGADDDQGCHHVAVAELDEVLLVVAPDAQFQRHGQRVDDGDTDAMQAAGNLVGILVELTAGMQLGHDDLRRRNALFGMDVGRDTAPVVGDGHGAIGVQRHGHEVGMACERFVDRVVDDLVDHVMQAGAVIGVADIHSRTLADRIQAAKDLDGICAIRIGVVAFRADVFDHPRGRLSRLGRARAGSAASHDSRDLKPTP